MTRDEHLALCKKNALEYLKKGEVVNSITSILSDIEKHPETKLKTETLKHLGMKIMMDNDPISARRFIEGFR